MRISKWYGPALLFVLVQRELSVALIERTEHIGSERGGRGRYAWYGCEGRSTNRDSGLVSGLPANCLTFVEHPIPPFPHSLPPLSPPVSPPQFRHSAVLITFFFRALVFCRLSHGFCCFLVKERTDNKWLSQVHRP
ncbi:hypothetical protein Mapa_013758 [Marchantia paleacea]|nr:hypothetical protein Mapa_013758 [Marchantia paleacea]